jgi:CRP-like cAMP-binding protein
MIDDDRTIVEAALRPLTFEVVAIAPSPRRALSKIALQYLLKLPQSFGYEFTLSFETVVNDLLTIVQLSKAFIAQFAGACVSEVIARVPARRAIGFLIAEHRRRN